MKKKTLYKYFKANEIVREHSSDKIIKIVEKNNLDKKNVLKTVEIKNLNPSSKYYLVKPENPTNIKPNKPTEKVIIEYNEEKDFINLIFVEMKPKKVKFKKEVLPKFEKTFTWLYLLFNLLNDKEGKNFNVFFLLCKYSSDEKEDEICKGELQVLETMRVKYTRITKYSDGNEEMQINFNEVLSAYSKDICEESER